MSSILSVCGGIVVPAEAVAFFANTAVQPHRCQQRKKARWRLAVLPPGSSCVRVRVRVDHILRRVSAGVSCCSLVNTTQVSRDIRAVWLLQCCVYSCHVYEGKTKCKREKSGGAERRSTHPVAFARNFPEHPRKCLSQCPRVPATMPENSELRTFFFFSLLLGKAPVASTTACILDYVNQFVHTGLVTGRPA